MSFLASFPQAHQGFLQRIFQTKKNLLVSISYCCIEGVNHFWKIKEFLEKQFADTKQIGFIAQELEKIYPELVMTDKNGFKSVDYSRLTPILVEAIKEQQKVISSQQAAISSLKNENGSMKAEIGDLKTSNIKQESRLKKLEDLLGTKAQR